jgi:hypothetical protein
MNTSIKSIKEIFLKCEPSLSKYDLESKEMNVFLEDKRMIEEKLKTLDMKNVNSEELKELDKVR